jgi:Zn-dependent peptidase ImmA (M78 family)/transcriptional regulator with XRE-family HTH domain
MGGIANPEMIVLGRQSRGRSQGQLAQQLQVSQGLISKIEHGATSPPEELLAEISESLKYPVKFFYRPEHVRGTDSICFHHRKRTSMPARLLATTEGRMYTTQLQVKSLLEDLEIVADNEFVTMDPDDHDSDPRLVAQALRRMWHLPNGPITNLVQVIEAAGAVVVFRDFGTPKLDGMSCWPKNCPPLFFINSSMPTDRARFTLAHELGHLIMHGTPPASDPEVEANQFALEFLAPLAEIFPDLRRLRFAMLPGLKAHWRISMGAIVMEAKTSDALPPNQLLSLHVQLSRNGYRTSEPFPLTSEEPRIVDEAIQVHLKEHGYSIEELAAMVDLLPDEFRTLYLPRESVGLRVLS